jgi:hypothetical protein
LVRYDDVLQENVSVIPYHIVFERSKDWAEVGTGRGGGNHRSGAPEPLESKRENSTTIHFEKGNTP